MKRRKALRRARSLVNKTPLARTTALRSKPKPKISAQEREAMGRFHEVARRGRCVVCGKGYWEARRAGTKLEAHHAIRQQTLRKVALARGLPIIETVWDDRNAVAICLAHEDGKPSHHTHTTRSKPLPRSYLPRRVFEFAHELALTHVIEREYPAGERLR